MIGPQMKGLNLRGDALQYLDGVDIVNFPRFQRKTKIFQIYVLTLRFIMMLGRIKSYNLLHPSIKSASYVQCIYLTCSIFPLSTS